MNEEQTVLDFFSQSENLPLGLAVAEQMDKLREQANNRFWQALQLHLAASFNTHGLAWQAEVTEDKNAAECLVGLQCSRHPKQEIYLRPMLEQQFLGGAWRIYFGLMWSAPPSPDHLEIAAVRSLMKSLQQAGYKSNANFLAWQWTALYPRRRNFLLRYAKEPEKLVGEMGAIMEKLLVSHNDLIALANSALQTAPRSAAISLERLRSKRSD